MKSNGLFLKIVAAVIAAALFKLAFFPEQQNTGLVTPAHAGAIIEWDDARRIVTTNTDGSVTYVWDYDEKTKVRRYTVKGDKLTLETFKLD